MKMTEIEVAKIATKVMDDIKWTYDNKKGARPLKYTIEEQIEQVSSQKNHPRFNDYVATLYPYWSVIFDFPEEDGWGGRNMIWVNIKDETGEPYEVGHRQWKGKVLKDENGKYYKENI